MDLLLGLLSSDALLEGLSELFHAEITRMTIAFVIAAKMHERTVKKENALMRQENAQGSALMRASIDHVADVLGKRLDSFDRRLTRIEEERES